VAAFTIIALIRDTNKNNTALNRKMKENGKKHDIIIAELLCF